MKKGDIIKFGNYPQGIYGSKSPIEWLLFDDYPQGINCSKSPIEWLVLDVNENEALLISRYGLDCKQYHHEWINITWEYCDLRKWLNSDFIKSAFSEEETKRITVSELKNDDNRVYRSRGGNDTKDRVFCLSINEAKHYFGSDNDIGSDNDRQCKPTAYARKQGVCTENGCCFWWLRSPGIDQRHASCVNTDGSLFQCEYFFLSGPTVASVKDDGLAVRPALRIICGEELERRQREEQEQKLKQLKELQAQAYKNFLAIIKTGIKKGMIIPFGSYPQNENGCRVPIEWLVLEVKGNEALLISRYVLDCKKYHHELTDINWENCDLRKWLNNDFIKSAFSEEEAKKIKVSELKNEDNPEEYRTRGGNNTKDRVFCLSIDEAEQYFSSDNDRQCQPTAYARKQGVGADNFFIFNDCCFWWLRSPGYDQFNAAYVYYTSGSLDLSGNLVNYEHGAVRPALRIICNAKPHSFFRLPKRLVYAVKM